MRRQDISFWFGLLMTGAPAIGWGTRAGLQIIGICLMIAAVIVELRHDRP